MCVESVHALRALCRRGAKEVAGLLEELKLAAERMCRANDAHMAREESSVLPVLQASLCAAEQRAMVWRTLRAMPLRLLERMLPWLAGVCPSSTSCDRDLSDGGDRIIMLGHLKSACRSAS